ncbi:MAG: DUF3575 domain-containing protein [Chitinophagaceae bacterium]|nr:DUF3575 domain-containing protein [Chitinophagaceae bacterium]
MKRTRINYCLLVLCFFSGLTHGQERKFVAGLNPFAPLGTSNVPRIEVFGEYFFARQSIALDIGLGNFMGNFDSTLITKSGYRLAASWKQYLFQKKTGQAQPTDRFYYGVNLFYWRQQWTDIIAVTRPDSATWYKDAYGIRRTAYGISAIIGYQALVLSRLNLDFYLGIGYKKLDIANTDRQYDRSAGEYLSRADCGIFPCIGTFAEDAYSRVNMTMGVRVGYVFFKKKPLSSARGM